MKILLVDDEEIVLQGIHSTIERNTSNWEVVALCDNGQDALEAIARTQPDVVITDIRMNGMSGLELAEKIKQLNERIVVILLTGYADFSFAQKALSLSVFDYLLKPTRYTDILQCLSKAEAHIQKLESQSSERTKIQLALDESRKELLEKHIMGIMKGFITDKEEIEKKSLEFGLTMPGYVVASTQFDGRGAVFGPGIRDKYSLNYAVRNICGDIFSDWERPFFVLENIRSFVMLVPTYASVSETRKKIVSCTLKCVRLAEELLGITMHMGVSQVKPNLDQLVYAYNESQTALIDAVKQGRPMIAFNAPQVPETSYSNAIQNAISYITSHYSEDISLKQVAQEVFLNSWYFSDLFKKEVGVTFTDFVLNLRIDKAKELLADRSLQLSQISGMVGISAPSYFSQVFRRITGQSPKEYRNSLPQPRDS